MTNAQKLIAAKLFVAEDFVGAFGYWLTTVLHGTPDEYLGAVFSSGEIREEEDKWVFSQVGPGKLADAFFGHEKTMLSIWPKGAEAPTRVDMARIRACMPGIFWNLLFDIIDS